MCNGTSEERNYFQLDEPGAVEGLGLGLEQVDTLPAL